MKIKLFEIIPVNTLALIHSLFNLFHVLAFLFTSLIITDSYFFFKHDLENESYRNLM